MSFLSAVRTCLAQYASFRGRARRSEYWFFTLFVVLTNLLGSALKAALANAAPENAVIIFALVFDLLYLALLLPHLAVTTRRLHDTDHSGWWILIGLIPVIGTIIVLIWMCTPGDDGPNRFGPPPTSSMPPHPAAAVA